MSRQIWCHHEITRDATEESGFSIGCAATADTLKTQGLPVTRLCFLLTLKGHLGPAEALLLHSFILQSKLKEQPLSGT